MNCRKFSREEIRTLLRETEYKTSLTQILDPDDDNDVYTEKYSVSFNESEECDNLPEHSDDNDDRYVFKDL